MLLRRRLYSLSLPGQYCNPRAAPPAVQLDQFTRVFVQLHQHQHAGNPLVWFVFNRHQEEPGGGRRCTPRDTLSCAQLPSASVRARPPPRSSYARMGVKAGFCHVRCCLMWLCQNVTFATLKGAFGPILKPNSRRVSHRDAPFYISRVKYTTMRVYLCATYSTEAADSGVSGTRSCHTTRRSCLFQPTAFCPSLSARPAHHSFQYF